MAEFTNVTVVKKANIHSEGAVGSRLIRFEGGTSKILGVMLPGDYEFDTAEKEIMEIISGELQV